jgi:hypothetical protein
MMRPVIATVIWTLSSPVLAEPRISDQDIVPGFALLELDNICPDVIEADGLDSAAVLVSHHGFVPVLTDEDFYSIRGSAYSYRDLERTTAVGKRYVLRLIQGSTFYMACEIILDRMEAYGQDWTVKEMIERHGPPKTFSENSISWDVLPWSIGVMDRGDDCAISFELINMDTETKGLTVLRLS